MRGLVAEGLQHSCAHAGGDCPSFVLVVHEPLQQRGEVLLTLERDALELGPQSGGDVSHRPALRGAGSGAGFVIPPHSIDAIGIQFHGGIRVIAAPAGLARVLLVQRRRQIASVHLHAGTQSLPAGQLIHRMRNQMGNVVRMQANQEEPAGGKPI